MLPPRPMTVSKIPGSGSLRHGPFAANAYSILSAAANWCLRKSVSRQRQPTAGSLDLWPETPALPPTQVAVGSKSREAEKPPGHKREYARRTGDKRSTQPDGSTFALARWKRTGTVRPVQRAFRPERQFFKREDHDLFRRGQPRFE